jgi:hypothetical protein
MAGFGSPKQTSIVRCKITVYESLNPWFGSDMDCQLFPDRTFMRKYTRYLVFLLLLCVTGAVAQTTTPPVEGNPAFTQQELDQMLAPIALYPDSLLSQILVAATYPLEVVQAARWSSANPMTKGDAAVQAVANQNWDPSVKSLVAFPQVLQTLDQKIEWTERLGDAFLAQQPQVMDTVQSLREKAQQAGNLASNAQMNVSQSEGGIDVVPANPGEMYVPYYDPSVVYGSWWWPGYPPIFWSPWAGYGWNGGFAWGLGIGIGADFFFGSWDWRNHRVFAGDFGHRNRGGEGSQIAVVCLIEMHRSISDSAAPLRRHRATNIVGISLQQIRGSAPATIACPLRRVCRDS